MDDDLMRWETEGGYCPPDDDPDFGECPFRGYYGWWLTYDLLRKLFRG